MRLQTLNGLPKPLPRLIVGTASLGSPLPGPLASGKTQDALRHLDGLLELGCTAFETAAMYMAGGTERALGEWIRSRRVAGRVTVITKGGHPNLVLGTSRLSPKALADDLHGSLRRLGLERIDLYLLHRDDPRAPVGPIVGALAGFQREGKIAAYGMSNWSPQRLQDALVSANARGLPPLAAGSPHFSLFDWVSPPWAGCFSAAGPDGRETRALHEQKQLPLLAWSPLGRGFLSKRIVPGMRPGLLELEARLCLRTYGSDANFARRDRLESLAKQRGVSPAQLALAYVLQQPFPSFAIVAASTAAKMRQNIEAAELSLGESERRWLESGEGGAAPQPVAPTGGDHGRHLEA
ncbi:MAG TPA: aldo/keto reductase [Myxococcaceae bacterium]